MFFCYFSFSAIFWRVLFLQVLVTRLAFFTHETLMFVTFWSDNCPHSMCNAVLLGRPTKQAPMIPVISIFFALLDKKNTFDIPVHIQSASRLVDLHVLSQHKRICSNSKFDPEDLEQLLLVPSVHNLDRFDFRSVLDFVSLHLRSACGSVWLSSPPKLERS